MISLVFFNFYYYFILILIVFIISLNHFRAIFILLRKMSRVLNELILQSYLAINLNCLILLLFIMINSSIILYSHQAFRHLYSLYILLFSISFIIILIIICIIIIIIIIFFLLVLIIRTTTTTCSFILIYKALSEPL